MYDPYVRVVCMYVCTTTYFYTLKLSFFQVNSWTENWYSPQFPGIVCYLVSEDTDDEQEKEDRGEVA